MPDLLIVIEHNLDILKVADWIIDWAPRLEPGRTTMHRHPGRHRSSQVRNRILPGASSRTPDIE